MRITLCSLKRFNCSLDDVPGRFIHQRRKPAMPVTDDHELAPLAILAVNTLRETYHQRGPHAFDEAALILFMAIGSIIARTRGPETLHGAMEAVRLAVETEVSTGPAHRRRSTNE